jgi:flavin-dependent dehydrogenase
MTNAIATYDCAIIGGGIGGLCLSIQLARMGHSVILFEKHQYPFHKVCGEYVSNESYGFLSRLGVPLKDMDLPRINNIGISSEKGFMFHAPLELGGFGISRYTLDHLLFLSAKESGVTVLDHTKVIDVKAGAVITGKGTFATTIIAGSFGKTNPVFAKDDPDKVPADNYVGVKYHIRTSFPADRIELHNFDRGYCGVSKIEDDKYCLCYLVHSDALKASNNSIPEMEQAVLHRNPFLRQLFANSDFLFDNPVTVSNVKFGKRKLVDDRFLYLGDAAGCISPLTGNGMSMAAYTSFMLSQLIDACLQHQISYEQLKEEYAAKWNEYFLRRISRGKQLQYLFGKRHLSDLALRMLNPFGKIKSGIIESTHGDVF